MSLHLLFQLVGDIPILPEIIKGKKYIRQGTTPPKGATVLHGPKGGNYYLVEDKHLRINRQEHELIRSRGVTRDQWKEIEEKYKSQGARSVEFINLPNNEKNAAGKNLYNIYVSWPSTDDKIGKKKAEDKAKFSRKKAPGEKTPESTDELRMKLAGDIPVESDKSNQNRYKIFSSDEIPNQIIADNPTINLSAGKTPAPVINKIASWLLDYLDQKGYEAESTPVGKNAEGKAVFNLTWKPKTDPKVQERLYKVDKYGSELIADFDKKHAESDGWKRIILRNRFHADNKLRALKQAGFEHKLYYAPDSRESKYGSEVIYYRNPGPSNETAPARNPPGVSGMVLFLPHDPGLKRAWVGKYSGIAHDPLFTEPLYDTKLIQPFRTGEDTKQFEFTGDGLYQAQGSGEGGRRYYQVSGGKVIQLNKQEWDQEALKLPKADAEVIKERIKEGSSPKRIKIAGNTIEHKDWIKSTLRGKWNPSERTWEISVPPDESRYQALVQELSRRGLSTVDWGTGSPRATA